MYTLYIKITNSGTYTDYTSSVIAGSLKLEKQLFNNDLESVISKLTFSIKNNTLINQINSNDDIYCQLSDGSNYIFTGYLSHNTNTKIKSFVEKQELTFLDNLYFLDKELKTDIILTNAYIKKDSDQNNSIFHQLLNQTGLTSYVSGDITTQLSVFKAQKGENILKILDTLLKEYGYLIYASGDGAIGVKQIKKTSWTPAGTIANANMINELEIEKKDTEAEACQINWNEITLKSSIVLAEDTTGADASHRCNISVGAYGYYPTNSNTQDTFIEYKSALGDVVIATSATLNLTASASIQTQTFTNKYTKAQIKLYNNSGTAGSITKLQITGNAYIKKSSNISLREIVSNTTKKKVYEAKYIYDVDNAKALADWWAQYYYYSRFKYKFKSKTAYTLGECYTLTESILGINTKVIIRKMEYDFIKGYYNYEAEAITEYTAGTATNENTIQIPATEIISADLNVVADSVLTNITQNSGTNLGGFTTTPTTPTWGKITVQNWLINLSWDKQWNLSNLDYYELQVSQNGSTWYDFDGNLGGYTIAYQESAAYKGGFTNSDPPLGIGYYFRVRRKTKSGTASSWSTNLLATTVPIGKDGTATNGLIYLDANNFWDFVNSKFKIGTSTKYIYFDSVNIYFKSVDIELTTADLITYNSGKTKRLIHTGLSLLAQGGTNFSTTYGGIKYDESTSKMQVIADEYYQNTDKIIYRNSNNEYQADLNAFNCKKYLIYGTNGEPSNWITNITPVLRQRDIDNTSNYYIVIKTGIIAYGYSGGLPSMYDITAKIFSYGDSSQIEARWTGYIYSNNSIIRPLCYIRTASKHNLVGGAYVGTDGYLRVFLYSSTPIYRYYIHTEVWFNNYNYAKKIYSDNWSISYVDSISGYDTNYGIAWHKTYGDVYSEGDPIILATASLSGASSYTRYFVLNYPAIVRCSFSGSPTKSGFTSHPDSIMLFNSTSYSNSSVYQNFLPGKYQVFFSFSTATSTTITLYCAKVQGYAPYSKWTATDICPGGLTTS